MKIIKDEVAAQVRRLNQQQTEQKLTDLQVIKLEEKVDRVTQTITRDMPGDLAEYLLDEIDEVLDLESLVRKICQGTAHNSVELEDLILESAREM